jgi:chromosome segregation ATPase
LTADDEHAGAQERQAEIDSLAAKLASSDEALGQCQQQIRALEAVKHDLESQVQGASSQGQASQQQISELQRQLAAAQQDVAARQQAAAQADAENVELQAAKAELQQRLAAAQHELQARSTAATQADANYADLQASVAKLQAANAELQQRLDAASAQAREQQSVLQARHTELQQELQAAQAQAAAEQSALQAQLDRANSAAQHTAGDVETTLKELNEARARLLAATADAEAKQTQIADLEQAVRAGVQQAGECFWHFVGRFFFFSFCSVLSFFLSFFLCGGLRSAMCMQVYITCQVFCCQGDAVPIQSSTAIC